MCWVWFDRDLFFNLDMSLVRVCLVCLFHVSKDFDFCIGYVVVQAVVLAIVSCLLHPACQLEYAVAERFVILLIAFQLVRLPCCKRILLFLSYEFGCYCLETILDVMSYFLKYVVYYQASYWFNLGPFLRSVLSSSTFKQISNIRKHEKP